MFLAAISKLMFSQTSETRNIGNSMRPGRSRIFAAPAAAHLCCACAVAGEPGGRGVCVVAWADAPPVGCVEVERSGGGQGHVYGRRAVVGIDTPPKATRR